MESSLECSGQMSPCNFDGGIEEKVPHVSMEACITRLTEAFYFPTDGKQEGMLVDWDIIHNFQ